MAHRLSWLLLSGLALGGCAHAPPSVRGPCTIGASAEPLLTDPSQVPAGARVLVVGGRIVECSCGLRRLGADTERRAVGGDQEARRVGGDQEARRVGGDQEGRRVGGDQEGRRVGGDQEARRVGGHQEARRVGGDQEARKLGGDQEGRRLAGDRETRSLGGAQAVITCSEQSSCPGYVLRGVREVQVISGGVVTRLPDACVPW